MDQADSDYHKSLVGTIDCVAHENRVRKVEELIDQTQKGDSDTEHHENVL